MKVFCLEHKRGFLAPRQNPIRCENRTHVLGELDFAGQAKFPRESGWEYCCNCEFFWTRALDHQACEKCPVCERQISVRYLCDRCYTISLGSPAPAKIKNFTITSEGAPQPSCPGCLQSPANVLREHSCDDLGAALNTALTSCPICKEPIGDAPSFPASVAEYLNRIRAAKKIRVHLDYQNNLLVAAEDGEFVLVQDDNGPSQLFILPRLTRFTSKQDFYDYYQDYYYCANPSAGEVQIIAPALGEKVLGGWALREPGVLEVLENAAEKLEESVRSAGSPVETRRPIEETIERQKAKSVANCPHCGEVIEKPGYEFCWNCGKPLKAKRDLSLAMSGSPSPILAEPEQTLSSRSTLAPVPPAIFAWASTEKPASAPSSATRKSILAVALIILAGLVFLVFILRRSSAPARSPGVTTEQEANALEPPPVSSPPAAPQTDTLRREDDELKKLRERRATATPSEGPEILEAFESAEEKYPADYRFPYERAKLAITGTRSHRDPFGALMLAAEKAIENGKADEMLNNLMTDKDGDFFKLSRGHGEWKLVEAALKNKDKSGLRPNSHE